MGVAFTALLAYFIVNILSDCIMKIFIDIDSVFIFALFQV